ncbi:hypothetical protein D9M69_149730 [compost metagenome]
MTHLPALLDDLLGELRQPQVRDLAWTLLAPPLLERTALPQRHPLAASGWLAKPDRLGDWLLAQERHPLRLHDWLDAEPRQRLGRYYERLWQYALEQAPDIRLLAANLPVRDNGHTLGELDLLIEDDDGLHHLELAIKLYLGPAADGPEDWLGPGAEDQLRRKLQHLYRHQLPLSSTLEGSAVVQAISDAPPQASLWLGGYLFYPWPDDCPPPAGADPHHLRGRWLRRRDWPAYRSRDDGRWQMLPRATWLSPARIDANEVWSEEQFDEWLERLPEDGFPQLLVRLEPHGEDWCERERLFLVGDRWPEIQAGYLR